MNSRSALLPIDQPELPEPPGYTVASEPSQTGNGSWQRLAPPAVTEIGLIQNVHEDRWPLRSHLGAWVGCTDQPAPFRVTAYDNSEDMLADIEES